MIATIRRWIVEIVIVALVILLAYLWLVNRHEARVQAARAEAAEAARDKALQDAAKAQVHEQRAEALQAQLDIVDGQRKAAVAHVAELESELAHHPVPAQPGPVPTEQSQVLADLITMGTNPEAIQPARVAFPATDAPTLWTWGKEALRVPGLEDHAKASDALNLSLKDALKVTTSELSTAQQQRDEFKLANLDLHGAVDAGKTERGELKLQVGTLTTQRDRARKTRIYVGFGAFILGAWAEHKLTH